MLQSCSSEDKSTTIPIVKDDIKPPYTVKYEVTFSTNTTFTRNFTIEYAREINGKYFIASALSRGQDIIYYSDLSKVWTRSFTVTVDDNPLQTEVRTNFNPSKETDVNFKIFINNVLMENSTTKIKPNTNPSITALNGISYHVY
jgi:hypothetical protein